MIDMLRGVVASRTPVSAVIDVQGVGYLVQMSVHTAEKLPPVGESVTLLTHLHVREDAMQLFGFADEDERRLFRQLQTISGIGARMALGILSGIAATELRSRVATGDVVALTRIPGVGRKTAERIVVELRDVMQKEPGTGQGSGGNTARDEALLALQALGYARAAAEKAISTSLSAIPVAPPPTAGEIIKHALKLLSA
jgi:holliday junction DNA helicase RuvA